jgi:hypothetical protein
MASGSERKPPGMSSLEWVIIVVLLLALTFISVYGAHSEIVDIRALAAGDIDRMHNEVISGHAVSPTQYRVGAYWLAEVMKPLFHGDLFAVYQFQRFIFTFLAGILLAMFLRRFLDASWALAGVMYFYAALPWAYLGYHHQPADPINLFLFLLAYNVVVAGCNWWLIPIVAAGVVNRETVLLLPIFDFVIHYDRRPYGGHFLRIALEVIAGIVVYAGLYLHFGPRAHPDAFIMIGKNLRDPLMYLSMLVFILPIFVLAIWRWHTLDAFPRRCIIFAIIFTAFYFVFGYLREMRLMTPIIPLLLVPALMNLKTWFYKDN